MAAMLRHNGRLASKKTLNTAISRLNGLSKARIVKTQPQETTHTYDHSYCKAKTNVECTKGEVSKDPSLIPSGLVVDDVADVKTSTGLANAAIFTKKTDEKINSLETADWKSGRRIVNLYHLAVQLQSGCKKCKTPLNLINTTSERLQGAGSFLSIKCMKCKQITLITTDKRHQAPGKCMKMPTSWDVNSKLSLGMFNAGLGPASLMKLFSALNIPPVHHTTLKRKEREVGPVVESLAKSSCQAMATKEKLLSEENKEPAVADTDTQNTPLSASFDGAWQKRGSGRAYNSLSGHASMIGKRTGKVIAYGVRCKSCKTCEAGVKTQTGIQKHDCRKNWDGSSKAMEASMCVSMLKDLKSEGVSVRRLIMDNDSTSIARARTEVDASMEKASDTNHLNKSFTSKLYDLAPSYKQLSGPVINHISRCFMYAVQSNCNDSENIKKRLSSIVPHLFGNHDLCDIKWCRYLQSPKTYVPIHLPNKRYLSDSSLKEALHSVFQGYIINNDKLKQMGSTQRNECFNNQVAAKNPKSKHYSGSESTCFRVASAVAETNIGESYVSKVYEELDLSPGTFTTKTAKLCEYRRKRKAEFQATTEYKRRRLARKASAKKASTVKELREGLTYKSSVELSSYADDACLEIPTPAVEPAPETVSPGDYEEVIFDLETTDLGLSDIVQLAACCRSGQIFNRYVSPKRPMTLQASKVTGLSTQDGRVFKNGIEMPTSSLEECLVEFNAWLCKLKKPILLVAHNAYFDASVLMNKCVTSKDLALTNTVVGFVDTLKLFKQVYPGLKSYRQENLVKEVLKKSYDAHNAIEDCNSLQELYEQTNRQASFCQNDVLKFSFTTSYVKEKVIHTKLTNTNLHSLDGMIKSNVITKFMAKKIAGSGLSLKSLELAYTRDPSNGIKTVFGEKVKEKCRVTKTKKIVDKCNGYLAMLHEKQD